MDTTIRQTQDMVGRVLAAKLYNSPMFLHSSPGIGKSAIIHQLAELYGLKVVDLRL